MQSLLNTVGGYWVSFSLLLACRFRMGKGSYLAWRKETAFGKDGQFPYLSTKQRRTSIQAWARWAWRNRLGVRD